MDNIKENKINKRLFVLSTVLIFLDQITKFMIKGFPFLGINHEGLFYGQQIPVINESLVITFIENPGMAFGISFGWGKIFLSLFSIVASFYLAKVIINLKGYNIWVRLGFTLIFAGAVGNLIDRVFYGVIYGESPLFYGKVVDFIQVDIPDIDFLGINYTHWPVFNVADSCVSIGVVLLLIFSNSLPTFAEILNRRKNNPRNLEVEN